jgi:hypothetical protein
MKWGFILALITTGVGYMLPDDHHGHGDNGHGHGSGSHH